MNTYFVNVIDVTYLEVLSVKVKMISIMLVLLVLILTENPARCLAVDRYRWIASTDEISLSYDEQTIQYVNTVEKKVSVWTEWVFTEEGARRFVAEGRAKGTDREEKWDHFQYYKIHQSLNSKRQIMNGYAVYYDDQGNVIDQEWGNQQWEDIVPDTLGEAIYNIFRTYLER